MSLTMIVLIVAAMSLVIGIGLWIVRDAQPTKTDRVKNILAVLVVLAFAITAGSIATAIVSSNANTQKSRENCVNVDNGYVVNLNGYDFCFEEPPKLIGKI